MGTAAWKPVNETSAWKPVDEAPAPKAAPQGGIFKGIQDDIDKTTAQQPSNGDWRRDLQNFGGAAASTLLAPVVHPLKTLGSMAESTPPGMLVDAAMGRKNPAQQMGEQQYDNFVSDPRAATASLLGTGAGMMAQGGVAKGLGSLKEPMQEAGIKKINTTVGSLKGDYARGANPGEGYFQAKLGPSASMGSIAQKASDALDATGQKIGDSIKAGTGSGVKIPTLAGARPIAEPLNNWHSTLSGPGGGTTAPVEDLSETFRPSLMKAAQGGGFSPDEYFGIKRNVAKNTAWSDPTNIGGKQARQQIVGGMGDTLAQHVPELSDLNSTYKNLSKLSERAEDRATTGRPTLSGVGKGMMKAAAIAGGGAMHGVTGAALGAIPTLLDTVPAKTALASGLYYGGGALGRTAPLAGGTAPASMLVGKKRLDDKP